MQRKLNVITPPTKILVIAKAMLRISSFKKVPGFSVEHKKANQKHREALKIIFKTLDNLKLNYDVGYGNRFPNPNHYDLVIAVGGDGTFLRAAKKCHDVLLLGVNSLPGMSVGALLSCTAHTFSKKIKMVLKGTAKIENRSRLGILVNGKKLPFLALNDILYANDCSAGTTRYLLQINGVRENQRSSGVWIATPSGSTAAICAAGGIKMKSNEVGMQYLVREPLYFSKKFHLLNDILKKGSITLWNKTTHASLFIDGTQSRHPLKFGDRFTFFISKKSLKTVV